MRWLMSMAALFGTLLAASSSHSSESMLLGCWAQDQTGVERPADKDYDVYKVCFIPDGQLFITTSTYSAERPTTDNTGNFRVVDIGQSYNALKWSVSGGKLVFTGDGAFNCDFAISDHKLNLANCAPDSDWNGKWVFDKNFTDATNEDLAEAAKHKSKH